MNLDRLRNDVHGISSVVAAAVALIAGLATQLRDAIDNDDMSEVEDLATQLEASQDSLAQAVAANTVADSETTGDTGTTATESSSDTSDDTADLRDDTSGEVTAGTDDSADESVNENDGA